MKNTATSVAVALLLLGHAACSSDDDDGDGDGGPTPSTESTEFEEATLTPQGGTHEFAAGFKVVAPAGAVKETTTIRIRLVGNEELRPVYEDHGVPPDSLLVAVEGKPDGLGFEVPIKVILSAKVEPGDFPVVYEMDLATRARERVLTTVMADPENDLVELTMHHFTTNAAERQKENETAKKICEEEPCKCLKVSSQTKDKDVLCGTADGKAGCQVLEYSLKVEYPDCGKVHEERHRTIGASCVPEMKLKADRARICPSKDTGLTASINLGCPSATLEGQTVSFAVTGPASVSPASSVTNQGGDAASTLTGGGSEGTAKVSATSDIEYYGLYKYISFDGMTDTDHKNKKTKSLKDDATVEVKPSRWKGTLTYQSTLTSLCLTDVSEHTGTVDFEVDCETSSVTGSAKVSQTAKITVTGTDEACADAEIRNANVPASLDLVALGDADDHLHLKLRRDPETTPFYTYDICSKGAGAEGCLDGGGYVYVLTFGRDAEDKTAVPLKAGTHTKSFSYNDGEDWTLSYTIELQEAGASE